MYPMNYTNWYYDWRCCVFSEHAWLQHCFQSARSNCIWDMNIRTGKYTGEYRLLSNEGLVLQRSYKFRCTAASNLKAEYTSRSECVQKVCHHRHILQKLGQSKDVTFVYIVNQPYIAWASKHGSHDKCVEVRHDIGRKAVMNQERCLEYYLKTKMVADILAKTLGWQKVSWLGRAIPC